MAREILIGSNAILPAERPVSRRQLFQTIGRRAREVYGLNAQEVGDRLRERERLGSTALGRGVAVPHAVLSNIERTAGLFARLEKPVDF